MREVLIILKSKIKRILSCKNGFSHIIGIMAMAIVTAIFLACIIGIFGSLHEISVLDSFANEMAVKSSVLGKCSGTELEKRYKELEKSTGLSPIMKITGDYYNSTAKTVQYGDAIHVELILDTKLIGFSDFFIPITYTSKRVTQSEQYWK